MADETSRSKRYKISGDRKSGQIIKNIDYDPVNEPGNFGNQALPTLGEQHPFIEDLYYFDSEIEPQPGNYAMLIHNYSWKHDQAYDTELRTGLKQSPLRTNQNYRLKWDYALVSETQTTEPEWWDEAKSFDEIKGETDYKDYDFIKNAAQKGSRNLIKDRIKTVDFWLKPTKQVLERWYFLDKEFAQNKALGIGQNQVPADDFGVQLIQGIDPEIGNWLITSCPVNREGGYWVVRRTYELNDEDYIANDGALSLGWDDDFYGALQ